MARPQECGSVSWMPEARKIRMSELPLAFPSPKTMNVPLLWLLRRFKLKIGTYLAKFKTAFRTLLFRRAHRFPPLFSLPLLLLAFPPGFTPFGETRRGLSSVDVVSPILFVNIRNRFHNLY